VLGRRARIAADAVGGVPPIWDALSLLGAVDRLIRSF
jgi:hypothetical protein